MEAGEEEDGDSRSPQRAGSRKPQAPSKLLQKDMMVPARLLSTVRT